MTLRIRPNAIEQDHGPFTFPGIILPDGGTIGQAAGPLLTFDDANNFLEITGCRVGIGTTAPNQLLDVRGSDKGIRISDSRNITWSGGETMGALEFYTSDTSGGGVGVLAAIKMLNSSGVTAPFGALVFYTTGNAGTGLGPARVYIDHTGKVGVGTVSPTFVEGSGIHIADATAPVLRLQDSSQVNSDWEIRSPSAGNRLEFFHVNTAKVQLSLSSAGKFGIHPGGYVAPDGTLHVHTATAGAVTASGNYDDLVVENNTHGGMSILVPNTAQAAIALGSGVDNLYHAIIGYGDSHATAAGFLKFYVANDFRLNLSSTIARLTVPIQIKEAADDVADAAGYGQFWVKDDAPCIPMFTDDVGTKFTIDVTPV